MDYNIMEFSSHSKWKSELFVTFVSIEIQHDGLNSWDMAIWEMSGLAVSYDITAGFVNPFN